MRLPITAGKRITLVFGKMKVWFSRRKFYLGREYSVRWHREFAYRRHVTSKTMKIVIHIIFILLFATSCKKRENHTSSFYSLTKKLKISDSIDYQSENPFTYLKTGKIISSNITNSLFIQNIKDSLYRVELYTLTVKGWLKNDEVLFYEKNLLQFFTVFKDYNFDKQKDIYIQSTASNGYSLSRGNLILINPKTIKLNLISEARKLANINPDLNRKLLISESVEWCPELKVCKWLNQWKENNLITIDKNCPCK